jgi:hypothetical protein
MESLDPPLGTSWLPLLVALVVPSLLLEILPFSFSSFCLIFILGVAI